MRADQAQLFMEIPEMPQQDYVQWLRQPFPRIFIHFDQAITFRNYLGSIDLDEGRTEPYEQKVRAVLMLECPRDKIPENIKFNVEVQMHEIERVFQVHFFLHDKHTLASTDSAGLIATCDNRLLYAQHGTVETRKRMLAWAVHVINFLSSPSVKLIFQGQSSAVKKVLQAIS
jgi:hypothetical protein